MRPISMQNPTTIGPRWPQRKQDSKYFVWKNHLPWKQCSANLFYPKYKIPIFCSFSSRESGLDKLTKKSCRPLFAVSTCNQRFDNSNTFFVVEEKMMKTLYSMSNERRRPPEKLLWASTDKSSHLEPSRSNNQRAALATQRWCAIHVLSTFFHLW